MPIYAYKCSSCGHSRDVLQKLSDAPLTSCPECHAETFSKQLTAAGFQLRGSGWYATDFKNGSGRPSGASDAKAAESDGAARKGKSEEKGEAKSEAKSEGKSEGKSEAKSAEAPATGSCGNGGCAACS
jgi:putative FmdB family regulatory protein